MKNILYLFLILASITPFIVIVATKSNCSECNCESTEVEVPVQNMKWSKTALKKKLRKVQTVPLPACYIGGGEGEWGERTVAFKWTRPDACVLEFGGGAGSVSTVIQGILRDKSNHVVIQPVENGMFGGITQLRKNKQACDSQFHVIDHVLKEGEDQQLLDLVSRPFDTIVADCEDCLLQEYEKNPRLFTYVTQIQIERDDFETKAYDKLRKLLQMEVVDTGLGCDGNCPTEVWQKKIRSIY